MLWVVSMRMPNHLLVCRVNECHRTLKQQFLYDEVQAELNLSFDQLIFHLSDDIFKYHKTVAANLLIGTHSSLWKACAYMGVEKKRPDIGFRQDLQARFPTNQARVWSCGEYPLRRFDGPKACQFIGAHSGHQTVVVRTRELVPQKERGVRDQAI